LVDYVFEVFLPQILGLAQKEAQLVDQRIAEGQANEAKLLVQLEALKEVQKEAQDIAVKAA
jgi:hypothetical protein